MQTLHFKDYPVKRLLIDSIDSRLTDDERLVRQELMNHIISNCGPVSIEDIESNPKLKSLDIKAIIDSMLSKNVIVQSPEGRINFAYPVSALPTAHKVTLQDGRTLSAMCAIDAMGTAFTFQQDVRVDSSCKLCEKPISLSIHDGQLSEVNPFTAHALHVDLNKADNWAGSC